MTPTGRDDLATATNADLTAPAPGGAGGRPTRVRYGVMAFLCALSFLTYFDRVCIVRAQKDIQHDLQINDDWMALVFSAFWLSYALFEVPAGWLGDRFGARRALGRVVLAWSLFTALSGSAVGFASLLTWRFLFGAGEAGAYPNMAKAQSRWLPPAARARAGGLLWLAARWGAAFAPVLFGALLRGVDAPRFRAALVSTPGLRPFRDVPAWRVGFWLSGLAGVVWVVLFLGWFRDDPADKPSVNRAELDLIRAGRAEPAAEQTDLSGTARRPGLAAALITSPSLWGLALLYLCGSFGYSFFVSWMPKYFEKKLEVPFERSEWMSAAPPLCAGVACLAGGWLSDRLVLASGRKLLGRALFPVVGCLVAAGAMCALPFVRTPTEATVLMCVAAAGYDLGQGANWATIVDVGGAHAGLAAGFVNLIGNTGNFVQPVVGEAIFRNLGWGPLFLTYAGAYLAAGSMWLFIRPAGRFDAVEQVPA